MKKFEELFNEVKSESSDKTFDFENTKDNIKQKLRDEYFLCLKYHEEAINNLNNNIKNIIKGDSDYFSAFSLIIIDRELDVSNQIATYYKQVFNEDITN